MQKEFESSYEPKINLKLKCSILNDSSFASLVLLNDTRFAGASSDNIKIYHPKNNFHCDCIILNTTEITSLFFYYQQETSQVSQLITQLKFGKFQQRTIDAFSLSTKLIKKK